MTSRRSSWLAPLIDWLTERYDATGNAEYLEIATDVEAFNGLKPSDEKEILLEADEYGATCLVFRFDDKRLPKNTYRAYVNARRFVYEIAALAAESSGDERIAKIAENCKTNSETATAEFVSILLTGLLAAWGVYLPLAYSAPQPPAADLPEPPPRVRLRDIATRSLLTAAPPRGQWSLAA